MNKREIIKLVREISKSITDENDYDLVDVEFVKEGPNHFLRIYIDKAGGVTIDDCQIVSEALNSKLDEINPIDVSYYLEVSSPGLDRPLKTDKDLKRNLNKDVEIKLYKQLDNKKKYDGKLVDFNENEIIIENIKGDKILLPKEVVADVRLSINF